MKTIKIIFPVLLSVIYTFGLLLSTYITDKISLSVSEQNFINKQVNYQFILLLIATISLITTYFLNKESFHTFFSFGNISARGEALKIFGINKGDSWLKTGISLSIVITLVTGVFMYFQLKQNQVDWSLLGSGIGWILLFSLTNSFGEEMIYRIGIVVPLEGLISPRVIFLISAIIFGLAHINGMPSGIIGMALAGLLGYVLAKSVFETRGFFWAWFIHFLQDVVIIGSLYLMNNQS